MTLVDLVKNLKIKDKTCFKVHFATHSIDPLLPYNIFIERTLWNPNRSIQYQKTGPEGFKVFQDEQNQRNFQRPFILSLIKTPVDDEWIFAGIYDSSAGPLLNTPSCCPTTYQYNAVLIENGKQYIGEKIAYHKSFRTAYPNLENL